MEPNQNPEQGAPKEAQGADQNQQQGPTPTGAPQYQMPQSAHHNTIMGVLAYLGILVLIPYFVAKNDPFVHFHVKQGMALFGIEIVLWLLGSFGFVFGPMWLLIELIQLVILIFIIIGIVNVVQGKQKELPVIGGFAAGLHI